MYINNSRYSSKIKGFSLHQSSCDLKGKWCRVVGYHSYTHCRELLKKDGANIERYDI